MQALEHALEYTQAGLSVLPIATNGTKKPTGPWKEYQTRIADEQELREIFANGCGVGIIGGAVSRWLQIVDFEAGAPLKDFGRMVGTAAERAGPGLNQADRYPLLARNCAKTPN